ncbi:hypothetical protein MHU86_21894 [Fragilaria crotonensis]|nr:hypothetical protein MHU86_21894 [Fragilaria crotonensis]
MMEVTIRARQEMCLTAGFGSHNVFRRHRSGRTMPFCGPSRRSITQCTDNRTTPQSPSYGMDPSVRTANAPSGDRCLISATAKFATRRIDWLRSAVGQEGELEICPVEPMKASQ